ncbi:LPS O-antigen length regulator Wzz(fepE) [Winslowiella iniecta]|uniref:Polysaccharide chain length determinant N-terminal domain-containing protein n=1 Tax=Winslowiella iniecta TaxID=1560201 RepID=A0A0L7TE31_9GAMM|nr:LPS O-antigen length regulator Wzz(fepE) [Winslowiella iniecta]KOC90499.1 hypothetical protein NG42_09045 [Winslowiella iniecta]KOC93622.1 hypothetical protein NG43_09020 [Winslowiella iniecta]
MSNIIYKSDMLQPHTPSLTGHLPDKDDDLDLISFLTIILQRKTTIIVTTLLAVVLGVGCSLLLTPRWTSHAIIVAPSPKELRSMDKTITQLAVLGISADITPDSLLSDFMRNFDSRDLREKYLVNTHYFTQLVKEQQGSPQETSRLIDTILDGNIASHSSGQDKAEDKKEYRYYKVSYTAENATAARDLLEGYISYVTQVVEDELHQKINYQVDLLKGKAQGEYELELARAENAHQVKLQRLNYALSIANSAGLKHPSWSNGSSIKDDPDYSVTLGANGLLRKLEIERSLQDVAQLNPDLLNRRLYIGQLNALKINEMEILPFKYMRQPYEPLKQDKSQRKLLIILFALAGILGSSGYVLINTKIRQRAELQLPGAG